MWLLDVFFWFFADDGANKQSQVPKTVQDCSKECTLNSQPNRPYNSERVFGSNSADLQKSDGFDVPFFST